MSTKHEIPIDLDSSGYSYLSGAVSKWFKMADLRSLLKNRSSVHHLIAIVVLLSFIIHLELVSGGMPFMDSPGQDIDPWIEYGVWFTLILYFFKFTTFFSVPLAFFNTLGILTRNTSPSPPRLMSSLFLTPFICFRVVTRGLFPELVKRRVDENLRLCRDIGLQNFLFEVVTDNAIGLRAQSRVKELLVPAGFETKKGTLFKARALQYCLEENVSIVGDSDWIVHLDEETLMTESAVIGVVNFVNEGKYDFGQGAITYGKGRVVNWITSLADSIRTGFDYGVLRFTLGTLHRPVFSWKGSFIVSRASAERQVGYDFGPEGSIAEDCFFALRAWSGGFLFDYIEGEMREESPHTIADLIRQRRRWMNGIYLTFASRNIPWRYKCGVTLMVWAWITLPLQVTNIYFSKTYPVPVHKLVHFLLGITGGTMMFMFFFGADKSFHRCSRSFLMRLLIDFLAIINMPLCAIFELIAVVWQMGVFLIRGSTVQFDIIQKDNSKNDEMHV